MKHATRLLFAAIFVASTAMVLTAIFYFQEELGLEPCPMCILSRYAFITIAAVALAGAIHGPRRLALKVYGSVVALLAFAGLGVSLRHSFLQHFPPKTESCGADLDFLLNTLPLGQALPKIFAGTGSCSKVDWRFLGLSIPEWAGLWFLAFALVCLWLAYFRKAND